MLTLFRLLIGSLLVGVGGWLLACFLYWFIMHVPALRPRRSPNRSDLRFERWPGIQPGIDRQGKAYVDGLNRGGYRASCWLAPMPARPPGHELERRAGYDSEDNRDFLRGRVTIEPVRPIYKSRWKPPAGCDPKLN
jgi:hypothetical protein